VRCVDKEGHCTTEVSAISAYADRQAKGEKTISPLIDGSKSRIGIASGYDEQSWSGYVYHALATWQYCHVSNGTSYIDVDSCYTYRKPITPPDRKDAGRPLLGYLLG